MWLPGSLGHGIKPAWAQEDRSAKSRNSSMPGPSVAGEGVTHGVTQALKISRANLSPSFCYSIGRPTGRDTCLLLSSDHQWDRLSSTRRSHNLSEGITLGLVLKSGTCEPHCCWEEGASAGSAASLQMWLSPCGWPSSHKTNHLRVKDSLVIFRKKRGVTTLRPGTVGVKERGTLRAFALNSFSSTRALRCTNMESALQSVEAAK